ncbi:MAG: hypothetical protein P9M13_07410 [Candidatus Ancaeobacter aquaticus]|nr:hypothetical protein [Candidatus Ancaeobacter aquaticus]
MKKIIYIVTGIIFFSLHSSSIQAYESNDIDILRKEFAQTREEFRKMQGKYEKTIDSLNARIEMLEHVAKKKSILAPKEPLVTPPGMTPPTQPIRAVFPVQAGYSGMSRYFQNFNPDISVIGDFIYHWTDQKQDPVYDQFQFRELELAFQAYVDTYARADVFAALHQEGNHWHFHLEEGYLTFLTLPFDLQAKAGQFRPDFGKANKYHIHSMPWVDYPNVIQNYFGFEGMMAPGVGVSWLVPNPWDHYIELMYEMFNNTNDLSFAGPDGRDLVYMTHIEDNIEINDESTVEFGGSFAVSPSDDGHGHNKTVMEGADITYKWRPLKKGLYTSLVFQNEVFACQKTLVYEDARNRHDSWGMYSSLVYQFMKRWSAFTRYDFSEFPNVSSRHEHAVSGGLTFAQSEYCFWRVQYKHTERNFDKEENEIWLQLNFGLGPHRKHEY